MNSSLVPLIFYFFAVVLLVAAILFLSRLLGQSSPERATGEPYESGMVGTALTGGHLGVNFFLLAVFFVIFDIEAVFIFGWAVAIRELGWSGYVEILIFIGVLLAALFYLWRIGALEISRSVKQRIGSRVYGK